MLHAMAERAGADTVVIDSLKDAALKLSDEETGQGLSRAMNYCVSNGIEVIAYHHQTKRSNNPNGKPNTLADVYGSSWITAGAGSVILLWGNAGDLVVELNHLKQPAAEVGPLMVGHDHARGLSYLYEGTDTDRLMELLRSGPQSAATVASWLYGDKAGRAEVAKARRRLDRLVDAGTLAKLDEPFSTGGAVDGRKGGGQGARYAIKADHIRAQAGGNIGERDRCTSVNGFGETAGQSVHAPNLSSQHTIAARSLHGKSKTAGQSVHASVNVGERGSVHARTPPLEGGAAHVHAHAREGEISSRNIASGDTEVCARCYRETQDFVPAPGGKRWCRVCAYPTENMAEQYEEDE